MLDNISTGKLVRLFASEFRIFVPLSRTVRATKEWINGSHILENYNWVLCCVWARSWSLLVTFSAPRPTVCAPCPPYSMVNSFTPRFANGYATRERGVPNFVAVSTKHRLYCRISLVRVTDPRILHLVSAAVTIYMLLSKILFRSRTCQ